MSKKPQRSASGAIRAVPAGKRGLVNLFAPAARSPDALDAPTVGDHRRIRNARSKARVRARKIDADRDAALVEAFRTELGEVVRSASPLLISMLAIEGLTLDDAVASLEPKPLWPSRPRLSGSAKGVQMNPHHVRYHALRPSQFKAGVQRGRSAEKPAGRQHPGHRIVVDGLALEPAADLGRDERDAADRTTRRDHRLVGGVVRVEGVHDGEVAAGDQRGRGRNPGLLGDDHVHGHAPFAVSIPSLQAANPVSDRHVEPFRIYFKTSRNIVL